MPDRCTTEEAEARLDQVMALQEWIMDEYDLDQVGHVFTVLCEGVDEDGLCYGRRYADSPDVDEQVYFTGEGARPGQFIEVRITALDDGCLIGETV